MSIHDSMYKVVLAERDYERHIVTVLRQELETARANRRDLAAQVQDLLAERGQLRNEILQLRDELAEASGPQQEMFHGPFSI